jgi:uncharacterized membrane protein
MIKLMLLLSMTLSGALGGFFFKKTTTIGIKQWRGIQFLGIGGCLYLCSSILNIALLQMWPYIVVYPLTAITYIWTFVISMLFLKETITMNKMLGVCFIIGGAILLAT